MMQRILNLFIFWWEKLTSVFRPQSVNENVLVILEYLKNLTSKQMAAEILELLVDLKNEISPIQKFRPN